MAGPVLKFLINKKQYLQNKRDEIDAEIAVLDKQIMRHQAISLAGKLGIKLMDKTMRKAEAWGTIFLLLNRHGPLKTSELKCLINESMTQKEYNTLRSHLFRMDLERIIYQSPDKRWHIFPVGQPKKENCVSNVGG